MSMLRKIAVTGLVSLTLAVGSIATVTPALAHGGGDHGGGGHGGGGHEERMGGGHFGGGENRDGSFFERGHFGNDHFGHDHFAGRFRDRGPVFFGNDDDYDRCQWQWVVTPGGHRVWDEACY